MTQVYLQPDTTKMAVAFLRAQPEVTALTGAAASVRGKLIKSTIYPAVKVTRITSSPIHSQPFVVDSVRVQLDCYGGNNREAERLAQTVRWVMVARMVGYSSDGGLVTRVVPVRMDDLPDEEFTPAKERYVVEMDVWTKASTI